MRRAPNTHPGKGDLVQMRATKGRNITTLEKIKNLNAGQPHAHISDPDFAQSSAPGWVPTPEHHALQKLKQAWQNESSMEVHLGRKPELIADLHDFEIYRTPTTNGSTRDYELMSLGCLGNSHTINLSMNGFLSIRDTKVYVQGLSIKKYSVEGYDQLENPDIIAYVQSDLAAKDIAFDIWFRIGQPSRLYKPFHDPFLCVAQMSKHVMDYVARQPPSSVGLRNFRQDFHKWLARNYHKNKSFQRWHTQFGTRTDFRVDIVAYREFLYREAYNLTNSKFLLAHPIWGECMVGGLTAVKKQPMIANATITTPHVYENFKHMYFGSKLRAVPLAGPVAKALRRRQLELGFSDDNSTQPVKEPRCHPYKTLQVKVGDVVAFVPNEQDTTKWSKTEGDWLAYVQRMETLQDQVQRLYVLYMYRPSDTTISTANYCSKNEIFFSDDCNCKAGVLLSTELKGKYVVDWSPRTINPSKGYYARQTYLVNESAFVTLRNEHKTCSCRAQHNTSSASYKVGDTVYIKETYKGRKFLEPVMISHISNDREEVTVRQLLRIGRDCSQLASDAGRKGHLAPNELVLTDRYVHLPVSCIERRCQIRYVSNHDVLQNRLPFGYDRGGAADLWFISMGLATVDKVEKLVPLSRLSKMYTEGIDLECPLGVEKLTGLSLFSGGGNFDRGLEDGGAVEFQYAVELDSSAIHTQLANAKDPSKLRLFYGSVDDYMGLLLSGTEHELVAKIGDVHFIAAGSPCPGFSTLQQDPLGDKSQKNASLITTLLAAVEVLRPSYAVLENVVSMGNNRKDLQGQNVLAQLIACLVSIGYQVSQYIMDSWNYGSAQRRSRVFVSITAPGLEPIKQPSHTHSRPSQDTPNRSLGIRPDGELFGQREWYPTPFQHVSAGTIFADLPNIGNGNIQSCISHPDHRVPHPQSHSERCLMACIPLEPPGCGYKEAYELRVIPKYLQKPGREVGRAYQRIVETGLVPTITTTVSVRNSQNGASAHWFENRSLTVLDARRTQGYLDKEPIIGNRAEQYRIVGNAVDRKIAFAEGVAIRGAVVTNRRRRLGLEVEHKMTIGIGDEDEGHFSDVSSVSSSFSGIVVATQQLNGGDKRPHMVAGSLISRNTLRDVVDTDDEDEGHLSDVSSSSSGIIMAIPQLDGGHEGPDIAAKSSRSQKPGKGKKQQNPVRDAMKLSRHSPPSEDSPQSVLELMAAPSQPPSLATVTGRLKSMTIQSRRSSLSPASRSSSSKRSRDSASEDLRPRKLNVSGAYARSSSLEGKTATRQDGVAVTKIEEPSRRKYTRHSGLEVEFVPQRWDRRPEVVYGKTAQRPKE